MGQAGEAVVIQRAVRGRAGRRKGLQQRERVNTILADEEERWRGRVSGRGPLSLSLAAQRGCERAFWGPRLSIGWDSVDEHEEEEAERDPGICEQHMMGSEATHTGEQIASPLDELLGVSTAVTRCASPVGNVSEHMDIPFSHKRAQLCTWPSLVVYPRVWDFPPSQ